METIGKSSCIINKFLFNKRMGPWEPPLAFFIHTSIANKWVKVMRKEFTNSDWEMYDHILQIASKRYEMRMIIVIRANKDQLNLLENSIRSSQTSFPWEENPTLFIDAALFNTMKKFIRHYNLEAYILKIEEKLGISVSGGQPIKVVSFNQSVSGKLDLINAFQGYSYFEDNENLFMIFGFPWQQSYFLQKTHFDDFYSVLPIILRHLGTLNYANDLNIIDLLSLRLSISDVRDPSKSNCLKYEIDFMIKRVLAKLIKNNHLSINEYLVAKNSKPSKLLILYLAYEFQNFFKTVDIEEMFRFDKLIILEDVIKLKEETDVLNKLKKRFNVRHRIDGKGFDKMSLSLFVGLIESENVYEIELDTNYRWLNNVSEYNRIITAVVYVYLRGENTYNFIEAFAAELKTVTFVKSRVILKINFSLNDYRIFDNLKVYEVIFECIKIDLNMLENLQQCEIKPSISLFESSFENTSRNWELLNNLGKLRRVTIYEDEGTWLSMFEFILKELHKTKTNEFQFKSKRLFKILLPDNIGLIDLHAIKFTSDEQNSKLEIRKVYNNEIVDIYCKKCKIEPEEKPDYEFYE